jgi:hypothetical protein
MDAMAPNIETVDERPTTAGATYQNQTHWQIGTRANLGDRA